MYIQNRPQDSVPFTLPKGYSGNAFVTPQEAVDPAPPQALPAEESSPTQDMHEHTAPPEVAATVGEGEAAEAFLAHEDDRHREHGIFSKIPFLSSLLPPPRKKHGERDALPEWAILGIVLFLLLDTPENDLLPFLLLLLLWD